MPWSVNIGSIAGTAVRIHITFLDVPGVDFCRRVGLRGHRRRPWAAWCSCCCCSPACSPMSSATSSPRAAFGVATPDVTLLPIGGVARLERIPEKPSEEFLIAIAGPLVNVAIALVLMVLMHAHLDAQNLAAVESTRVSLVDRLAEVNLFLALFNLIPAFPMDGGRVLRALLATQARLCPRHRGRRDHRAVVRLRRSASSACSTIRC